MDALKPISSKCVKTSAAVQTLVLRASKVNSARSVLFVQCITIFGIRSTVEGAVGWGTERGTRCAGASSDA